MDVPVTLIQRPPTPLGEVDYLKTIQFLLSVHSELEGRAPTFAAETENPSMSTDISISTLYTVFI